MRMFVLVLYVAANILVNAEDGKITEGNADSSERCYRMNFCSAISGVIELVGKRRKQGIIIL